MNRNNVLNTISLFLSASTLLCCALPALLITLGLGFAMAGLAANFPQLIWLSMHKGYLFVAAGLMLTLSGYIAFKPTYLESCPVEPGKKEACQAIKTNFNKRIFFISVSIFMVGVIFAYLVPLILT